MATAEQIIGIARGELGVKEDPPYSNNVKYNTKYYGREVNSSAYAWCMAFVWWVFTEAGAPELFYNGGKTAGCTTFMRWAKSTGRWITGDYRAGDIILYDFDYDKTESEHVGICEDYDGKRITCIEGNTGSGSDADGGQVQRRVRSVSYVIGAYRPDYAHSEKVILKTEIKGGRCTMELRILSRGCTGEDVRSLQLLLAGNGFDPKGIDGNFGPGCQAAVKQYQKKEMLEADGYVGPQTWSRLLGLN